MTTLRTSFSPMKFLISTSQQSVSLFLSRLTLMGKLDMMLVMFNDMQRPAKSTSQSGAPSALSSASPRALEVLSDGTCSAASSEEMCDGCDILGIYVTHLVLVTLGDTDDQVVLLQSAQSFLPCQYRLEGARDVQSGCGQCGGWRRSCGNRGGARS